MSVRVLTVVVALAIVHGVASAAPRAGAIVRVPRVDPSAGVRVGRATAPLELTYFYLPGARQVGAGLDRALALQARHPARLALRIRIRPLPGALRLSEALVEASVQDQLVPFEAAVRDLASLDEAALLGAATAAGLDATALQAAWRDGRHGTALRANEAWWYRLAGRSGRDAVWQPGRAAVALARMSDDDLEAAYQARYHITIGDRADDAPPPAAGLRDRRRVDELLDRGPPHDPLAAPPTRRLPDGTLGRSLDLRGWPALGPAGAPQLVTLICNLRRGACSALLAMVAQLMPAYAGELRVGWAPWFDPDGPDATATGLFHDAVACAEAQGAGWAWLDAADASATADGASLATLWGRLDALVDTLALRRADFYRCVAVHAGQSVRFARRAIVAGLDASPALLIGGRVVFGGPIDAHGLADVLADDAGPGILARLDAPPREAAATR